MCVCVYLFTAMNTICSKSAKSWRSSVSWSGREPSIRLDLNGYDPEMIYFVMTFWLADVHYIPFWGEGVAHGWLFSHENKDTASLQT